MNQKSKLTFGKIFERFAYGCGDFGCNIIYTAMSAFLLFYYTVLIQGLEKQDRGSYVCVSHLQYQAS
mgnify:CR=1 FL=1